MQIVGIRFGRYFPSFFSSFFQNEATFPLVRKDYYKETIQGDIHKSGNLPLIKFKKMRLLT